MLGRLKKAAAFLAGTPFHPQWLGRSGHASLASLLRAHGKEADVVLDIGCFNKWPKQYFADSTRYVGLDLPETANNWYRSVPDIYADACALPISDGTLDLVLVLDVCEHIADTDALIGEIRRVLKPGACVLIQMPFLYPLHDEPRDFVRFTEHKFRDLAAEHGFLERSCTAIGHPIESACLLMNLALTKTALNWLDKRSVFAILSGLLVVILPFNNLFAKLLSRVSPADTFMPRSYQVVLEKRAIDDTGPDSHG